MHKVLKKIATGTFWCWTHKLRSLLVLSTVVILASTPLRSQVVDPCCALLQAGLSSISSALTKVVGGGLNNVLSVDKDIQNFEQTVVWPQNQINQARLLVLNVQGIYGQMESLSKAPIASATLPGPQQLERTVFSRDPSQLSQTTAQYQGVYGPLPGTTDAPPEIRNLIDSSDATAQAALKKAITIDALADLQLKAADQLNQSLLTAAPGSAPIIEAQADAWLVRSHAYTQSAMADLIRVMAAELANNAADTKLGASETAMLNQQLQNLLKRQ